MLPVFRNVLSMSVGSYLNADAQAFHLKVSKSNTEEYTSIWENNPLIFREKLSTKRSLMSVIVLKQKKQGFFFKSKLHSKYFLQKCYPQTKATSCFCVSCKNSCNCHWYSLCIELSSPGIWKTGKACNYVWLLKLSNDSNFWWVKLTLLSQEALL